MAFFVCKINISVGNFFLTSQEVKFLTFQNFTDVRFDTFSILTYVSFAENEISTNVRFRAFFLGQNGRRADQKNHKKLTPKKTVF